MRELNRILAYLFDDDKPSEKPTKHDHGMKMEVKIK